MSRFNEILEMSRYLIEERPHNTDCCPLDFFARVKVVLTYHKLTDRRFLGREICGSPFDIIYDDSDEEPIFTMDGGETWGPVDPDVLQESLYECILEYEAAFMPDPYYGKSRFWKASVYDFAEWTTGNDPVGLGRFLACYGSKGRDYREAEILSVNPSVIQRALNEGILPEDSATGDGYVIRNFLSSCKKTGLVPEGSLDTYGDLYWVILAILECSQADEGWVVGNAYFSLLLPMFSRFLEEDYEPCEYEEEILLDVFYKALEVFKGADTADLANYGGYHIDADDAYKVIVLGNTSMNYGYNYEMGVWTSVNPSFDLAGKILDEVILWFDERYHFLPEYIHCI